MEWLASPEFWIALLTLTTLEIVLGIDNIVFISIITGELPPHQRGRARVVGLALAMIMRIALLASVSWIVKLTNPLVEVAGRDLSGRDLIMLGGGLFLIYKATREIHDKLEGEEDDRGRRAPSSFAAVITQIALLDGIFSLDSVITAVGMTDNFGIMVAAVVTAVSIMLVASGPISEFVQTHPTIKMLALNFLLLIGMTLVAEGWHFHIPKGYLYFAMGFSIFVEVLNLRLRQCAAAPAHLHRPRINEGIARAAMRATERRS
jgi:predicted tellurium resistance membrane protein TerC